MYDVTALGEVLVDFTLMETGTDGYPVLAAHPGGAPANFLAAVAKRGGRAAFLGKVGNDTFGRLLDRTLRESGIDTSGLVISEDTFTTLAFVTLDEEGNREFSFARKPGADTQLTTEEVRFDISDNTRLLHFGTLSLTNEPARSTTYAAVRYAKQKGKLVSYDPNYRAPLWRTEQEAGEQMLKGLSLADVVKISDEEVEFLFGLSPQEGGHHILKNYPVRLVFVTCGARGCYFFNEKGEGYVPALPNLKVKDTTGAGDIFGGSAIWKLLELGVAPEDLSKEQMEQIVRFATRVAGLSTTRSGGISSVPSDEELL